MTRQHPKHNTIETLLRQGLSNAAISRQTGADKSIPARLRADLGIPPTDPQPLTLEQKWTANTREVDGGHLEWTGPVTSTSSATPVMRYRDQLYTAGRIAFRLHHGSDPAGYAKPGCGMRHCVAPDHQVDTATTRPVHGPKLVHATPALKLAAQVVEEPGGHVGWSGARDKGVPLLLHRDWRGPAARFVFRERWGREPEGLVLAACEFPHCLNGDHLDDAASRAAHRRAFAALGL
ncbi:hypothetical protein [Kitasatospora sp. NPDC004289]